MNPMPSAAETELSRAGSNLTRAGERPVDLVHLARQTFGDQALEREVLRLFLDQSGAIARRLAAAAPGSAEQIAAAHRLKGSANGIGAWKVARLADAIETGEPASEAAAAQVAALTVAIDEANRFIRLLVAA